MSDLPRTGRMPPTASAGTGATARAPAAAPPPPAQPTPAAPRSPAKDVFRRPGPGGASGESPRADEQLLAEQSRHHGVIGEAQAIAAIRRADALPSTDRARFQQVLDAAGSDTERAFLYKALAAGYPLGDVERFAGQIRGWDDQRLIRTLNLSAHTAPQDRAQGGVAQQFEDSCVPTTAQVLRGEMDPIYSLEIRTRNQDPHSSGATPGGDPNPTLRAEQQQLLEEVGNGRAVPVRAQGGQGTERSKIDDVLNSVSGQTGLRFTSELLGPDERSVETQERLLDRMADQLRQGIPTPFELRTPDDTAGHYALALAVEGEGREQRFLVHDPYTGNTGYVTRVEFEWGAETFPGWDRFRIAGYARAAEPSPPPAEQAR